MYRQNWFLTKVGGKFKTAVFDLVVKPFTFATLLALQNIVKGARMPVIDKRCHLFMQAATNVSNYYGDRGLTRWFQHAKWEVFIRIQGNDNGYIVRDLNIFEEYNRLLREAQREGEHFPNGKTHDYVEREIIAKGYHKLKVKH